MEQTNLSNLFEKDEKLNLDFNFKKMFLNGHKYIPTRSKKLIFPFLIFMLIIGLLGIVQIISDINSFIKYGYGLGIVSFLPTILVLGICIVIYIGTTHHWFKKNERKVLNNIFALGVLKRHPQFKYNENARKNLYVWMDSLVSARFYIPEIKFEYHYNSKNIKVFVADVVRTNPGITSPSGAIFREQFTAIFLSVKSLKLNQTKLLKTEDIIAWLKLNISININALKNYKLRLRAIEHYIIIEFDNEIVNPKNKLILLEYLQKQIENNESKMKSTNKIELENYQKKGMNLGEIINDIRQNYTQTKPMRGYDFKTGETSFQVGPIKYTYKINIESESIEVHDDFDLHFYIDIEGVSTQSKHFIEEKGIAHKSVAVFMYDKADIPDFKQEIEAHFNNHIKQLNLNKTDDLYAYLYKKYQNLK